MYKMGFRRLVLLVLTAFLCISAQTDACLEVKGLCLVTGPSKTLQGGCSGEDIFCGLAAADVPTNKADGKMMARIFSLGVEEATCHIRVIRFHDRVSDEEELVTLGVSEDKNDRTLPGLPVTPVPGSERTASEEDSRESNTTSSMESNSTEEEGSETEDSEGKDFLEMLTLIGIIVGAIIAVIVVLTIIVVIIKKMSGGYSP